jgi:CBS domain-containing protein
MRVIEGVRRSGFGVAPDSTVRHAATTMERAGVGALAVVDGDRLVGIVTDRDLVCRVMATGGPLDGRVDAVMSSPAVTIDADADLHEAFAVFRTHGVRRLAVVRGRRFVGMVTVDDLLIDLAGDLSDLSRPVTGEVLFPQHAAETPVAD